GDLRPEDLSLVDLESSQVLGSRPRTSEILLHLEIYKSVPRAKAVIHCHPPYATAHAIAGVVPQGNLLPEQEVFIGPVALTPYETPGTIEFAKTVLPVVSRHNTILLRNHGIVCWAGTVTHAEWLVEVIETYCKTVMIAKQLASPLKEIPPAKIDALLAIKKRLGLPDARYNDETDGGGGSPLAAFAEEIATQVSPQLESSELEVLVTSITEQIATYLQKNK